MARRTKPIYHARRSRTTRAALITHGFTKLEVLELSKLPYGHNTALDKMLEDREIRRGRFERLVVTKIQSGKWSPTQAQIEAKWMRNLSRMYTKHGWRIKEGRDRGAPNPWAMYRTYLRVEGGDKGKAYISDWEIRQVAHGKSALDKGLIFVKRQERQTVTNPSMIRQWIAEKDAAIRTSRGESKAALVAQRGRLERLLRRN